MKDTDIKLNALNDRRTEILERGLHFFFVLLHFSLCFHHSNSYANVYTKFKPIYMNCQSPASGPRLQQV